MKKHQMVCEGDRVCVGLSGGADSVFLLQVLLELRERLGITVCAFHVNHCLRGEESEADQQFAERFCRERGTALKVFRFEVRKMAAEQKKGLEETGRIARRQAARECLETGFAGKIALAHHSNDRAETVLFHLARGSSVSGLKGIAPVSGPVIHPLLCVTRSGIEQALRERRLDWCTDRTNLEEDCVRNRIRLRVLPFLEEEISHGAAEHIAAAAEDLNEADRILEALAADRAKDCILALGERVLIRPQILQEKHLLAGYMVLGALKILSGSAVDLTRKHIEDVLGLMRLQAGRIRELPYGIRAERTYDGVLLSVPDDAQPETIPAVPFEPGREIAFQGMRFRSRILDADGRIADVPKKMYTKWLDYDKMPENCFLRGRRSGDYLVTDAAMHRKKLKEYFINEKIPREERASVICLAGGSRILWVIGGRISEDCKVTDATRRILEISVSGGKADEYTDQDTY